MGKKASILIFTVFILFLYTSPVYSETAVYHGADSVFTVDGIAVIWAILKNRTSDPAVIYIAIDKMDTKGKKEDLKFFSLIAADVFSGKQKLLIQPQPLHMTNMIQEDGKSFDEMSKRRIFFYKDEISLKSTAPDMEIFYFGVPDTTPVFLEKSQIDTYFHTTLLKLSAKRKASLSE